MMARAQWLIDTAAARVPMLSSNLRAPCYLAPVAAQAQQAAVVTLSPNAWRLPQQRGQLQALQAV